MKTRWGRDDRKLLSLTLLTRLLPIQCCNAGNRSRKDKACRVAGVTRLVWLTWLVGLTLLINVTWHDNTDKVREAEVDRGLVDLNSRVMILSVSASHVVSSLRLLHWQWHDCKLQQFQRVDDDAVSRPVEDILATGFCHPHSHSDCASLSTIQFSGVLVCYLVCLYPLWLHMGPMTHMPRTGVSLVKMRALLFELFGFKKSIKLLA